MINDVLKAYVEKADVDVIRVQVIDNALDSPLRAIGFSTAAQKDIYVFQVADNRQKAKVFDALRSLGVAFSAGKEWCPSEVFEYLRDEQLLSGKYLRVAWTQPGQYRLTNE
ncbi:hypothetical protein M3M50_00355 [Pseudomonas bijieensis]|uniref:hypothetical protein n=1 Tax=Pseudomonas bijieensis TaxID=2681983 RepID=UPI00200CFBAB|nr:hypothetical protein [Pseudomonas bijieensis]UQI31102.1 hypothetical protein M3M50_00355 [Pseudomonas bijieensis]